MSTKNEYTPKYERKVLWDDHPSILHYTPTFVAIVLLIIVGHIVQTHLYPYPWHAVMEIGPVTAFTHTGRFWHIDVIYLIYLTMFLSVIYALYLWLKSVKTRYIVANDQLIVRYFTPVGIIVERTELYRIVDFSMSQSFIGMLFHFSEINLLTSDRARHYVTLKAVRSGPQFLEMLRGETERCRDEKGVREFTSGVTGGGWGGGQG